MSDRSLHPIDAASDPATDPQPNSWWQTRWRQARRCLRKDNENYLLNLFTAMLAASALVIMLLVGTAIYSIYSSAMVKNAEAAAVSLVRLIMSAEVGNLLKPGPGGQSMIAVNPQDIASLDLQMHRYLKPFSMHKIKLYTPDKKIVYSTDPSLIGKIDKDNQVLDGVLTHL